MEKFLEIVGVTKSYGAFRALDDITLCVNKGEFLCFLGPSGCGKTTLLRAIAGLEVVESGQIVQDGRDITWLPPSKRDFGIVFQSYALFPNLSIRENIAFGLRSQGKANDLIASRVADLIAVTGLSGQEDKYPAQLSGGQQQRVALARAIAPSPGLLLLDEPLSALDAKVRAHLRREIKSVHRRLGVTTIMVTHDQEEALTMADRIVVMRHGRIEQIATPAEIYGAPATPFVADFIGEMNLFEGATTGEGSVRCSSGWLSVPCADLPPGTSVLCAIRPEHIEVCPAGLGGSNMYDAELTDIENLGSFTRLYARTNLLSDEIRVDLHNAGAQPQALSSGEKVSLHIPADRIRLYRKDQA